MREAELREHPMGTLFGDPSQDLAGFVPGGSAGIVIERL